MSPLRPSEGPSQQLPRPRATLFAGFQLAASFGRQLVKPGAPPGFGNPPSGSEQSGFGHAVERGVQRTCLHAKNLVRHLLDVTRIANSDGRGPN